MTIALVLAQPPGYSETFFNTKIKGLMAYGVEVHVYVQHTKTLELGYSIHTAPRWYKNPVLQVWQVLTVSLGLLPYTKRVVKFMRLERQSGRSPKQIFKNILSNAHLLKARVDWVHFGFATMALNREHIAKAIGAKMAVSCRGYDMDVYPLKHPRCYKQLWEQVDKVHVISEYMKQKALAHGMNPHTQVVTITPAIALSELITEQSTSETTLQLTTIARLHWIKGLVPTLEALALLKAQGIVFQYDIIGSGPQYEELVFSIHQLGLNDCVCLVGVYERPEVIERLANTHIYLQYSHSEGFCNAVLEAQAMGCLCVVSNGGALPENVLQGQTGVVVEKHNPEILAKVLMDLMHWDEAKKQALRTAAQHRVETQFGIEAQIQKFLEFYGVTS